MKVYFFSNLTSEGKKIFRFYLSLIATALYIKKYSKRLDEINSSNVRNIFVSLVNSVF